jgi:hypothetical protein
MSLYSYFKSLGGFREFSPQNPRLILIKHETNPKFLYIGIYKTRHEGRKTNTR